MKGDGAGRKVDADALFGAGVIGAPGGERHTSLFVELVFLMRGPVGRHKDLQPGDEIAKACFASGSGNFLPIADEFCGVGRGGFLNQAIFRAGETVGRCAVVIVVAAFKCFFEILAKLVAAPLADTRGTGLLCFRGTGLLGFRDTRCWHYAMQQVGRVKRIDDEVGLRRAVRLSRKFKMKRTLADVRALGRSGLAIRRTAIDVATFTGRFDVEVPGRAEEFQRIHRASIPAGGVAERNLGVADQHRDVVGPSGHGARNLCRIRRYLRERIGVRGISAEIDGRLVEDFLDARTQLISTLGAHSPGKEE